MATTPDNSPDPAAQEEETPQTWGSIGRNGLFLGLVAAVTTALIAVTQLGTEERIEQQIQLARTAAMRELLHSVPYDNALLQDPTPVVSRQQLGYGNSRAAYRARLGSEIVAVLLPVVAPDGYTGAIELLVAVDQNGKCLGVRTVQHRETPGLGDKIDLRKSPWILSFEGTSLQHPPLDQWTVRKSGGHFDQFTGATITPLAVIRAVHRSLIYVAENRTRLFDSSYKAESDQIPAGHHH